VTHVVEIKRLVLTLLAS